MTHLKKYWYWYLIAIVVVAAILAYFNWETVKGWFGIGSESREILDANGNPTGQRVYVNTSARQRGCCSVGPGFIGNCNFPIKPTDNIPSCSAA